MPIPGDWRDCEVFVFDVEGTLVDAVPPTLRCWQDTLRAAGHAIDRAALQRLSGMDGDQMLRQLLPNLGETERERLIKDQGRRYRAQCLPKVRPFAGVRELFGALRAQRRRLAIATDCARDQLRHYLDLVGIEDLLDAIACGDDVEHGKPEPDLPALALARAHGASGVMIGDTPFDAAAARKAGLKSVGVLTGGFNDADLRHAGCAAVYAELAALHAAL